MAVAENLFNVDLELFAVGKTDASKSSVF